jgi:hypothetical protein
MRIEGAWRLCDDQVVRPVIRGEVLAGDGSWAQVPFLADTAADRTVFSADVLGTLNLNPLAGADHLEGVGGRAASVLVETQLRLWRDDGGTVLIKGQFAAVTEAASLDMSVLGRDVTNLFALIVDRPQDLVCLLGQGHRYRIEPG